MEGKRKSLHYPDYEVQGWQHHAGGLNARKNGALQKKDGIVRRKHYLEILKQHLKITRKIKLVHKWAFKWTITLNIL